MAYLEPRARQATVLEIQHEPFEMLKDSSSLSAMAYIHGFKKPMQTLRGLTTTKPMMNLVASAFLRFVTIVLEIVLTWFDLSERKRSIKPSAVAEGGNLT